MKTIAFIVTVGICVMILERIIPDQDLPKVDRWWHRVIFLNFTQMLVVIAAGLTWERYLQQWSLLSLSTKVSNTTAALICYLSVVFVFYWWHRFRHTFYFLWLAFHQIHHSPQRIETITSFYKHPLEIAVNSLIIAFLSFTILGINLETSAIVTIMTAFAEFFYHMNIKTPQWVGWFIQRPEMHRIHHQQGKHFNNFADLPVLDMIFGTYENPPNYTGKCGYLPEREVRLKEMFFFRNVNGKYKKN